MQKLDIPLSPSNRFIVFNFFLLASSLAVVLGLPLHWLIKIALIVIIFFYVGMIFYRHNQWQSLSYDMEAERTGRWQVKLGNEVFSAELCGDSTVTTWVSVLRFRRAGRWRKYSYVLFPDATAKDLYRQCVVRAKNAR